MVTVFISYSHKDEKLRQQLDVHLEALKRQGIIDFWHDREIKAGEEFNGQIESHLNKDNIILLLVSSDFIASDYCYDIELQRALERHQVGEARVIPVILRPCDWHDLPFGKLLATPTDGKPITKHPNIDDAFLEVTKAIKIAAKGFQTKTQSPRHTLSQGKVVSNQRSSNLRVKKQFSDHDKDVFMTDGFEYISNYFESSLSELESRNIQVTTAYRRINENAFSAIIYINGQKTESCLISLSTEKWMGIGAIRYSSDVSYPSNSFNHSIDVAEDGYDLYFTSALDFYGTDKEKMTFEGAAEYFWAKLLEPIQI